MAIVLSAALASGAVPVSAAKTPFRPFSDPQHGFAIQLPADWTVQEAGVGAYSIVAVAPDHHAIIGITVAISLPSVPTSDEFARQQAVQLKQQTGFSLLREGPVMVAGQRGFYRYFTTRLSADGLYTLQVYLVTPRWSYIVGGSTTNQPAYVQTYFQTILKVVGSFQPAS